MLPRKRSSRVATKEERDKEEDEKKKQRDDELAQRRTEEERKRQDRERAQREKQRQSDLAKGQKEEERAKGFAEADRERRLRKRRRLLAKQAQQSAAAEAKAEMEMDQVETSEGHWWEIGNHVEVFSDDDWWQAVVLQNNSGQNADMEIYVAYIGGSEDDNEWLSTTSVRVRAPTDSFWDKDDLDDEIAKEPATSGASLERKQKDGTNNGDAKERMANEPKLSNGTMDHINAGIDNTLQSVCVH